jgi:phosphotransferase system HPr (HPr) family protein
VNAYRGLIVMHGPWVTRTVRIVNPQGLHARPADLFVKLASQFEADVEVTKENECVDGKSILSILTLAAEQGTELTIAARGRDAQQVILALAELVEAGFAVDALDGQMDQQ